MTGHQSKSGDVRPSWTERLTGETAGRRQLALASFLESTVVPIPLEALVAPLMVAHSRAAYRVAAAIWLGCLVGAFTFYILARLLFESVVEPGLAALDLANAFADIESRMDKGGVFWTLFLISITPVPFQLATLGAGAVKANFLVFMAAVALSRGIRYFGLAWIAQLLGPRVTKLLKGRTSIVGGVIVALLALYAIYHILF